MNVPAYVYMCACMRINLYDTHALLHAHCLWNGACSNVCRLRMHTYLREHVFMRLCVRVCVGDLCRYACVLVCVCVCWCVGVCLCIGVCICVCVCVCTLASVLTYTPPTTKLSDIRITLTIITGYARIPSVILLMVANLLYSDIVP